MCVLTVMCSHTCKHARGLIHLHSHSHGCPRMCAHTHTCKCTCLLTHMCSHTGAHTHGCLSVRCHPGPTSGSRAWAEPPQAAGLARDTGRAVGSEAGQRPPFAREGGFPRAAASSGKGLGTRRGPQVPRGSERGAPENREVGGPQGSSQWAMEREGSPGRLGPMTPARSARPPAHTCRIRHTGT